jgi:hypothetical protein
MAKLHNVIEGLAVGTNVIVLWAVSLQ